MGDLFFITRIFILTCIAVVLLQIKVGDKTLEQRSLDWVATSEAGHYLQEVSDGTIKFLYQGWSKLTEKFSDNFSAKLNWNKENTPGYRHLKFQLERSQEYVKEKAQRIKESELADSL